ncbi:MAG: tetratricopeptide repeat protein [Verrucomicrobiota bacterium]
MPPSKKRSSSSSKPWNQPHRRAAAKERHRASKNKFWSILLTIMFVIVASVGVLAWKWPSIQARINSARAGSMVEEIDALIEAQNYADAEVVLRKANNLDPQNPEIIRLVAKYTEGGAPHQAISFLEALQYFDRATPSDEAKLLELYVKTNRFEDAEELVEKFLASPDTTSRTYEVIAELHRRQGKVDEQISLLEKALDKNPDNVEAKLSYAQARLASPIPDVVEVSWRDIIELSKDESLAGLRALESIRQVHGQFNYPQEDLLERYRNHPDRPRYGDPSVHLIEWDMYVYPKKRREIVENALNQWAADEELNSNDLNDRLAWLNDRGFHGQVGAFLANPEMLRDPALVSSAVQALIMDGRFDSAKDILASLERRGDPALSAVGQALVAFDANQPPEEVDKLLRRAIRISEEEGKPEYVIRLAYAALKIGRLQPAEQAFRASVLHAPERAYRGLAQIAERQGNLLETLENLENLCAISPNDANLIAKTTYLRLLLNRHIQEARTETDRLLADDPEDSVAKFLLSFYYYRTGNAKKAYHRSSGIKMAELNPRERAVLAAIRFANKDYQSAKRLMEGVSPYSFTPQEVQFLTESGLLKENEQDS